MRRNWRQARRLCRVLIVGGLLLPATMGQVAALAASPGGTPTPPVQGATPEASATQSPTAASTVTSTPTSTPTVHVTATPVPTPVSDRKSGKHRKRRRHLTPTPSVAPTSSATSSAPQPRKHTRRHHHRRKPHAHPTPTPSYTATPAPSPTPPITLQAEDSIAPVSCNGPPKPVASKPFLTSPYHHWTSIVSYFDHDSPNFLRDGEIITATGAHATPDLTHQAYDFPAYWSSSYRQFLYYDGHNGYDYNLSYRTIYAAAPGKVIYSALEYSYAPDHGYGNMVMISHRDAYVTLYGHFSRLLVHRGQKVRRGQVIGISGNTGHSTGPHLHFTVFHNCTPTDPYGWTGQGPDPLAGYKGETSTYLWRRAPLVVNPPPDWPGMNSLPREPGPVYLLLRLPASGVGTAGFIHQVHVRIAAALRSLHALGLRAKPDAVLGALRIDSRVQPGRLYGLPFVASIASTDVLPDARSDLLHALAHAALVTRHRRIALGGSRSWTGYLFHWAGRTFLLGKGQRGKAVSLRVGKGGGRATRHVVRADDITGAYAVDLGPLSPRQVRLLAHELTASSVRARSNRVTTRERATDQPTVGQEHTASRSFSPAFGLALAVLLVVLAGFALATVRRRFAPHG
ncbi:MAG: peptidoglycan DD-metalloendopeptidase family protein [Chloroflexota bacterium]